MFRRRYKKCYCMNNNAYQANNNVIEELKDSNLVKDSKISTKSSGLILSFPFVNSTTFFISNMGSFTIQSYIFSGIIPSNLVLIFSIVSNSLSLKLLCLINKSKYEVKKC